MMLLWLYAILRSIPNKLGSVMALLLAIMILYIPSLYNSSKMSLKYYPLAQMNFSNTNIMIYSKMNWKMSNWNSYIKTGQMFSMTYFMYFLMSPQMSILWDNLMK